MTLRCSLEFWSFEALVLLSGLLPNPKVETSVLAICLNITALVWKIPFGLSGVVSTRVSNELGARCPRVARLAINVVLVMAISQGILMGLVLMMARDTLAYAFSNEIQVVKYVSKLMPILAIANVLDGLQCVLSGIVRGCGSQKIGAYVNLGSYYIVGIPSAILLSFVFHLGGQGLWLGITCGLVVQVLSFFILTIRTNWEIETKKATERVHYSTIPVEEVNEG
ncbi:Multi antimicrobial extrusion protein [Trema orientale]|uniref:Multi antimicrobial extrusion protein n=1 Tax=Trema orientale TaxID=63057 RepID=A0A2P5E9R5_TREOI|nr:Multi antimicrobial extrusion protein [Trema orientale]